MYRLIVLALAMALCLSFSGSASADMALDLVVDGYVDMYGTTPNSAFSASGYGESSLGQKVNVGSGYSDMFLGFDASGENVRCSISSPEYRFRAYDGSDLYLTANLGSSSSMTESVPEQLQYENETFEVTETTLEMARSINLSALGNFSLSEDIVVRTSNGKFMKLSGIDASGHIDMTRKAEFSGEITKEKVEVVE